MSDLVLDLRIGGYNRADGLRVNHPSAVGGAGGYVIEAQQRSVASRRALVMRVSGPEGDVLDLVAGHRSGAHLTIKPASALSAAVGYAFRTHPGPRMEAEAARALAAVLVEGTACLNERVQSMAACHRVQSVAEGLPLDTMREWKTCRELNSGYRGLAVADLARLIRLGFTSENTPAYLGHYSNATNATHVRAASQFVEQGWTPAQMDDLAVAVLGAGNCSNVHPGADAVEVIVGWVRFEPADAVLAARAGLTKQTAIDLRRSGEWNEKALRTLAALRN